MFLRIWFVRTLLVVGFASCCASLPAANEGQEDFDKAIELKVTAEKLDDLAEVIERLDSALEKGLDEENEEIAEQMLVATLMQRGTMFATAAFNVPPQDPQHAMRVMQLRSWALTDLQRALELDKALADAQLQVGKLQSLPLGDNNAARRAFSQAIKADTATPEQKAEAYALRGAIQSDEDKQLEDLTKAVELVPDKPEYLLIRGRYLYGKEKFDEALVDIDKAIKLDDDNATMHELRGMILLGLEKFDEALASFDKASELAPEAALPYQRRAELYRQKGDLEKAVQQLTKALELAPDNVATLLIRSAIYFELEQTDKALADVEHAIKVAPRLAQPYMMRAEILAATDRLDEAITQMEELVRQVPGNTQLLNRLGSFYLMSGRPRKAIETLTLVVDKEPQNYNAIRFRADAHLNIGEHAEAVADFEKALALNSDDESMLNNYAWVLATSPEDKLRDGKKAVELATKAAKLTAHQTPHVLSTLGAAYAEAGDFETAKKWSQQAIELSKKAVEAAKDDEDRKKLQTELEQLEKELKNYEEKKPVRERQTMEEKPVKADEKKEGAEAEGDRLITTEGAEAAESTAKSQ